MSVLRIIHEPEARGRRQAPAVGMSWDRRFDLGTLLVVFGISVFIFSTPLRHGGDLLRYAQDDFFYYLTVARNLATGAGSTFDGQTLTNGYHPLYMLLLWATMSVHATLTSVYWMLAVLDVLSAVAIFVTVRRIYAKRFSEAWLRNGFAAFILFLCFFRLYHQMEVTLALPFGFLFLLLLDRDPEELGAVQWEGIGLIAALLTLSRLDAGLLVGLCLVVALSQRHYRSTLTWSKVLAFVGTSVPPLVAYLAVNWHYFHRLTPISGAAKQTRQGFGLAWKTLALSASPEITGMFGLSFVALCLMPRFWRRLTEKERVISVGGLLFPFVHWGTAETVSDWKLWAWYKYSLPFAMSIVLLLGGMFLLSSLSKKWQGIFAKSFFAFAMLLLLGSHYKLDTQMVEIAVAAEQVKAFAATHPGRYAMGDRAGMVAYVDGQPMIQTEGLMMDNAFLERIRRREPLREVLRAYDVDYYIGFEWKKDRRSMGCFEAREPAQAGASSPVMRGEFCEAPVAEIPTTSGRTLIFDVRQQR